MGDDFVGDDIICGLIGKGVWVLWLMMFYFFNEFGGYVIDIVFVFFRGFYEWGEEILDSLVIFYVGDFSVRCSGIGVIRNYEEMFCGGVVVV